MISLVLFGGGGHAKVVYEAAQNAKFQIIGFFDDNPDAPLSKHIPWLNTLTSVLSGDVRLAVADDMRYICAIGDNKLREQIAINMLKLYGNAFSWTTVIDPTAHVAKSASISSGSVILSGATVHADAKIGWHCIVNTGSIVEHDCKVASFVHIAPTAVLCGECYVDSSALIGVGAKIIPKIQIGRDAIVGAGTIVLGDVPHGITAVGLWKKKPVLLLTPNWLPRKPIDFQKIEKLLEQSISRNHFANNGPAVQQLETYVRKLLGISNSKALISVSNATAGLHAVIDAWKTYNVATQVFTFPASKQGPLQNATLVDVSSELGGLDISKIPRDFSPNVLIVTNVFGHLVKINAYEQEAKKRGAKLLFDNAATGFSIYQGLNACNFGNASVVSFHHTKPLGFGEGGMIIIDKEDEAMVRRIINFGYDVPKGDEVYLPSGNNYKMSDVSAAFILAHLQDHAKKQRSHHIEMYEKFQEMLQTEFKNYQSKPCLLPHYGDDTPFVSCFPVLFPCPVNIAQFNKHKLYVRKYYKPLSEDRKRYEVAWDWYDRIICFPCHEEVNEHDLMRYVNACKDAITSSLLLLESKTF